jgi:hypothetical protein
VLRILQGSAVVLEALFFALACRERGPTIPKVFLRLRSDAPALLPELRDDLSDLFCLGLISQAQLRSDSQAAVLQLAMGLGAQTAEMWRLWWLWESLRQQVSADFAEWLIERNQLAFSFAELAGLIALFLSDEGDDRTSLLRKGTRVV